MARFGRAISAGRTKEGGVIPGIAPAISTSSFRDAPLGAGPESITPAGSMDSGFVLRTPRNDEGKFLARFLGKRFKFQTFIPSHNFAISPRDAREFCCKRSAF
jgi:hypothetical protein